MVQQCISCALYIHTLNSDTRNMAAYYEAILKSARDTNELIKPTDRLQTNCKYNIEHRGWRVISLNPASATCSPPCSELDISRYCVCRYLRFVAMWIFNIDTIFYISQIRTKWKLKTAGNSNLFISTIESSTKN